MIRWDWLTTATTHGSSGQTCHWWTAHMYTRRSFLTWDREPKRVMYHSLNRESWNSLTSRYWLFWRSSQTFRQREISSQLTPIRDSYWNGQLSEVWSIQTGYLSKRGLKRSLPWTFLTITYLSVSHNSTVGYTCHPLQYLLLTSFTVRLARIELVKWLAHTWWLTRTSHSSKPTIGMLKLLEESFQTWARTVLSSTAGGLLRPKATLTSAVMLSLLSLRHPRHSSIEWQTFIILLLTQRLL